MTTSQLFTQILGIQDLEVSAVKTTENSYELSVCSILAEGICSKCGSKCSKVKSYDNRIIKDLPISGKKVILDLEVRQFECDCGNYFTESFSFVRPYKHLTILSVCTYLENGGTANIINNASGCNTQMEVEAICNAPCLAIPVISVNYQSIPDGLYQAVEEVNSTGTIPNNGTVNFKAGEVILLDNGFSIAPNADFSAEIEDCGEN